MLKVFADWMITTKLSHFGIVVIIQYFPLMYDFTGTENKGFWDFLAILEDANMRAYGWLCLYYIVDYCLCRTCTDTPTLPDCGGIFVIPNRDL